MVLRSSFGTNCIWSYSGLDVNNNNDDDDSDDDDDNDDDNNNDNHKTTWWTLKVFEKDKILIHFWLCFLSFVIGTSSRLALCQVQ